MSAFEFSLVYTEVIRSSNNNSTKRKSDVRRALDKQLRPLWEMQPFKNIDNQIDPKFRDKNIQSYIPRKIGLIEYVPLISNANYLFAELEITSLTKAIGQPYLHPFKNGDLDNKIKTLTDALRRPQNNDEAKHDTAADDDRIFCLLDDDILISKYTVESHPLLHPDFNELTRILVRVVPQPGHISFCRLSIP
jgi:hypothetical protein